NGRVLLNWLLAVVQPSLWRLVVPEYRRWVAASSTPASAAGKASFQHNERASSRLELWVKASELTSSTLRMPQKIITMTSVFAAWAVAAGVSPAVEGGILPPAPPPEPSSAVSKAACALPGGTPGLTASATPAGTILPYWS